jgi:hypothetical protein
MTAARSPVVRAADGEQRVRAALAGSDRFRLVTWIAAETGLTGAQIRHALARLDAAGELAIDESSYPFGYRLTVPPPPGPAIPAHIPASRCAACAASGCGACDDFPDCPAGRAPRPEQEGGPS